MTQQYRYDKVPNIMTLKSYQLLRRYINIVNNDDLDDNYFKIRRVLNIIEDCCLSVEQEQSFSINEMTVPYKGHKAGLLRAESSLDRDDGNC